MYLETVKKKYESQILKSSFSLQSIDVAALIGSLEKLEPNISELQNQEARNQWCGKVLAIRSSIEEMTSREAFTRKSDDVSGYDDNEKDLLRECWYAGLYFNLY